MNAARIFSTTLHSGLLTRPFPLCMQAAFKSTDKCKVITRPKLVVRKQFYKLKEKQKKFQVTDCTSISVWHLVIIPFQKRDGKPVWLKAKKDKLLYQITCVATFVGLAVSLHALYVLSFQKYLFKK